MSLESIEALSQKMERDSRALKSELFRACWCMRGGMTITEAYNTSEEDRKIIATLVEQNTETTKDTGLPYF